ncbi:short-chain dehydrogenase/reductase SDR [Hyaloraphidium curvatum]|nr:short-chain dehydrogenase/reductase SDR [Hyaloraphidium curvatum]
MATPDLSFKGKNIFITGASRGIGLACALRLAQEGANVAIAAKTTDAHPKLPGTIFSAAEEIRTRFGVKVLPIACDIRFEDQVANAIAKAVEGLGGIDVLINNASAIAPVPITQLSIKQFDLMLSINFRGTFLVSKFAVPHLIESGRKGRNPAILNMGPLLDMSERAFAGRTMYWTAKSTMSLQILGLAGELRDYGIGCNSLWPEIPVVTAAMQNVVAKDVPGYERRCRKVEIMADAAFVILSQDQRRYTGNFCLDSAVVKSQGVSDLTVYQIDASVAEKDLMGYRSDRPPQDPQHYSPPPRKVLQAPSTKLMSRL